MTGYSKLWKTKQKYNFCFTEIDVILSQRSIFYPLRVQLFIINMTRHQDYRMASGFGISTYELNHFLLKTLKSSPEEEILKLFFKSAFMLIPECNKFLLKNKYKAKCQEPF